MSPTTEELAIEIKNIKEDVEEIKVTTKENVKLFNETMKIMGENLVELKTITKQQVERNREQDKKLDNIGVEVTNLRVAISQNSNEVSWYQGFINKYFGSTLKTLTIIILIFLGFKIGGVDIISLLK